MHRIADIAREILCIVPCTRYRCVSAILVSILNSEENLSYWDLIKHFDRHLGAVIDDGPADSGNVIRRLPRAFLPVQAPP